MTYFPQSNVFDFSDYCKVCFLQYFRAITQNLRFQSIQFSGMKYSHIVLPLSSPAVHTTLFVLLN